MTESIRVALADDHPLIRAGIRATLIAQPDIDFVGEAPDGHSAQRMCQELRPDLLLLDLSMPGPPAAETVDYIHQHCPDVKILVLTAYDEDAYIRNLVVAGISGYVLKDEPAETVVRAVRTVMQGDTWFSGSVIQKLALWKSTHPATDESVILTERERQILFMITQACDNASIATQLNLAEQTVCNYVSRLYNKLHVQSRTEAMLYARNHGLAID